MVKIIFLSVLVASSVPLYAQQFLGNYSAHVVTDSGVIVYAGTPAICVVPYAAGTFKVSLWPDGIPVGENNEAIAEPRLAGLPWTLSETDSTLTIQLDVDAVRVRKYPVRLEFLNHGFVHLRDEQGIYFDEAARGVRFALQWDEHIYGGGERAAGLDHRGHILDFYNAPQYCYGLGTQNLNISIPFLLSTKDYGVFIDDTYPGWCDVGLSNSDVMQYEANAGDFSYFVLLGGNCSSVISAYLHLTGRPPLPPRWALGYLQSRFGYQSEAEARAVVGAFRQLHIPLDAIILDLYWFGWGQMGDLDWDYSHFQTPEDMIADFDSTGVKTVLITEPYILTTSENWGPAEANGYLTPDSSGDAVVIDDFWAGDAGLLDITYPPAADWFWGFYQNLVNQGVGGWWCDLGEPEMHPNQMIHFGGSAARVHNIYSLLWAKRIYEGYEEHFPNRRLFNLIRSGYAGMQRFGTFPWSGDVQRSFEGLRAQLPIMLNMSLSGVPYQGSDIGGFDCGAFDTELYVRWMQFGAFSPIMRAHGVGVTTEPVYLDPETREIVTEYIRLRYQLLPYNYTAARNCAAYGDFLASPLWTRGLNTTTADMYDEYFWGDGMLVAPVLEQGQTDRAVFLPGGIWVDFWDDTAYEGEQWVTVPAPLERLPLFVSAYAILPMIPVIETTRDYATDTLILHAYPHAAAAQTFGAMYEDDGMTAHVNDQYESIGCAGFSYNGRYEFWLSRAQQTYPGSPESRRMIIAAHRVSAAPDSVTLNAESRISVAADSAEFALADTVAWWNPILHRLYIGFRWTYEDVTINVHGMQLLDAPNAPALPRKTDLAPAYPNPFNAETTILFTLASRTQVNLSVYDLTGRLVETLVDEARAAGEHRVVFAASDLASGLYFCRLATPQTHVTQKLVLLR